MSKIEVNKVGPQCGTTVTIGCGAGQTVVADAATVTLGRCGGTVQLASGASQSGFGRTGTVDWQTGSIKTGDFTATNGEGYFVNTTSGAVTMTLPAGSAGAIVSVQDYNNTFDSNSCSVQPNGSEKINSGQGRVILTTEGEGLTLVYVDSTVGWRSIQDSAFADVGSDYVVATGGTITTSGNCKIHTFTGPGTFTVSSISSCAANNLVSHLVVAGGGSGGFDVGGGGGAGGFREVKSPVTPYTASPLDGYPNAPNRITVTATGYPITVGAGGAVPTASSPPGNPMGLSGNPSVFSSITSTAGGGGGGWSSGGNAGLAGGSGGGGAGWGPGTSPGGAGNTPPTTPAQGNAGGTNPAATTGYRGGSGGGATATGSTGGPAPISSANSVTAGATTSISGSPVQYARGGNGGNDQSPGPDTHIAADNTGDGGGGAGNYPTSPGATGTGPPNSGNLGGSGIVIIRYKYQ
jgi:hypothetical protein